MDVDGVLHPVNARHTKPFDNKCMKCLKSIVDATHADICVTSTWRLKPFEFKVLKQRLSAVGVQGVIGGTPVDAAGGRGEEIQIWLRANPDRMRAGYVVIDDLDLAPNAPRHALLRGRVVRTDGKRGLVEADVPRCIAAMRLAPPDPVGAAAAATAGAAVVAPI